MFACVNDIRRNAALYARQNFLLVACYERLARLWSLGAGVDGVSGECEAVLLAPDSIGDNHDYSSNERSIFSVGFASRKFNLLRQRV